MRAPLLIGLAVALNAWTPSGPPPASTAYVSPEGDYLTWTGKVARLALRLDTLNGRVTSLYWGQPDAVELIEGCA